MAAEQPKKREYFFKPGNQFGKGRPRVALKQPDVLLPAIFNKAGVNWAHDFTRLYKEMKRRPLNATEQGHFKMLLDLLPYLIVKVALKEGDLKQYLDKGSALSAAKATSALLRALEAETDAKSRTEKAGGASGLESGKSILPPPTQPA